MRTVRTLCTTLMVLLAKATDRELARMVSYLREENCILRARLIVGMLHPFRYLRHRAEAIRVPAYLRGSQEVDRLPRLLPRKFLACCRRPVHHC
jgi:hypothetical protein